jgi:hypothetical protein
MGERSPNYLRELERWARPGDHFSSRTPSARNREQRWIANTLREEWNRAAAKVRVRVRMYEGTKHSSATAWLAQGSSLQMIQRMLRHADSRSTERYAKLGDLALVDVIRPKARPPNRPNVDPVWIQGKTGRATPSEYKGNWRGGRDSNPRTPSVTPRNRDLFSGDMCAHGVLKPSTMRLPRLGHLPDRVIRNQQVAGSNSAVGSSDFSWLAPIGSPRKHVGSKRHEGILPQLEAFVVRSDSPFISGRPFEGTGRSVRSASARSYAAT